MPNEATVHFPLIRHTVKEMSTSCNNSSPAMQTLGRKEIDSCIGYAAAVCLLNYSLFVLPDMTEPLNRVITPLGSFTLFYQRFAFFTAQEHLPIIFVINIP